jgi:NAD(P)-dependent dehydrogenase (short-subunit alcohol dehydrogenase family)
MDLGIQGKISVVTGGGSGIGEAVAVRLNAEGAKVVGADLEPEAAKRVAKAISASGGDALAVVCDATNPEAVDALMEKAVQIYGAVDILVNNVGGGSGIALVAKSRLEDWDQTIELNFRSVYLCCRAAARLMIPRKQGRIINMSSVSGKQGEQLLSAYCAAKFGVIGFTETLARELARHNITVNAVCPVMCLPRAGKSWRRRSKRFSGLRRYESSGNFRSAGQAVTPLRRPQTAAEIAGLVAFLASHEARSITGQSISIDGGIVMG